MAIISKNDAKQIEIFDVVITMRFLFFLFFLGVQMSFVSGQIYENFKLQRVNDNVYISWNIKKGISCNGIEIQRSTDSVKYHKIHDIQGICGDPTQKVFYNYTDTSAVINQRNYYRLKLGAIDLSEVKTIDLPEKNGQSITIFPNPTKGELQINFSEINKYRNLTITALDGKIYHQQELQNSLIEIIQLPKPSGVYLFNFEGENGVLENYKVVKN